MVIKVNPEQYKLLCEWKTPQLSEARKGNGKNSKPSMSLADKKKKSKKSAQQQPSFNIEEPSYGNSWQEQEREENDGLNIAAQEMSQGAQEQASANNGGGKKNSFLSRMGKGLSNMFGKMSNAFNREKNNGNNERPYENLEPEDLEVGRVYSFLLNGINNEYEDYNSTLAQARLQSASPESDKYQFLISMLDYSNENKPFGINVQTNANGIKTHFLHISDITDTENDFTTNTYNDSNVIRDTFDWSVGEDEASNENPEQVQQGDDNPQQPDNDGKNIDDNSGNDSHEGYKSYQDETMKGHTIPDGNGGTFTYDYTALCNDGAIINVYMDKEGEPHFFPPTKAQRQKLRQQDNNTTPPTPDNDEPNNNAEGENGGNQGQNPPSPQPRQRQRNPQPQETQGDYGQDPYDEDYYIAHRGPKINRRPQDYGDTNWYRSTWGNTWKNLRKDAQEYADYIKGHYNSDGSYNDNGKRRLMSFGEYAKNKYFGGGDINQLRNWMNPNQQGNQQQQQQQNEDYHRNRKRQTLTERQLHALVQETVREYLKEQKELNEWNWKNTVASAAIGAAGLFGGAQNANAQSSNTPINQQWAQEYIENGTQGTRQQRQNAMDAYSDYMGDRTQGWDRASSSDAAQMYQISNGQDSLTIYPEQSMLEYNGQKMSCSGFMYNPQSQSYTFKCRELNGGKFIEIKTNGQTAVVSMAQKGGTSTPLIQGNFTSQ